MQLSDLSEDFILPEDKKIILSKKNSSRILEIEVLKKLDMNHLVNITKKMGGVVKENSWGSAKDIYLIMKLYLKDYDSFEIVDI